MKEKALIEESQHVQKFEDLFENVRSVTGHNDLERVVNEFTAKDEENFARYIKHWISHKKNILSKKPKRY